MLKDTSGLGAWKVGVGEEPEAWLQKAWVLKSPPCLPPLLTAL